MRDHPDTSDGPLGPDSEIWMSVLDKARAGIVVTAALLCTLPAQLTAQGGPGFLFRRPILSVTVKAGYSVPRASSQLFDFTRKQLTVDRSDFNGGFLGIEAAVRVSERVDLALGVGQIWSTTRSEFRDWVDSDDLPIEQLTDFQITPATLSAKVYLTDRGRSIGRFAWVPARVVPFFGAGGGFVWYRFKQTGDFVDFDTLDVFPARFEARDWAPEVHALAGLDVSYNQNVVFTGEARYGYAKADLNRDFLDFDKIDLAGLQLTLGISARF